MQTKDELMNQNIDFQIKVNKLGVFKKMRESVRGFGSEKPFEINELQEKSHFSPPEPSQQLPDKNAQYQQSTKPNDVNHNQKGDTSIQHKGQQKHARMKVLSTKIKQIPYAISVKSQHELEQCQQTQNANLHCTKYTFMLYLGIFVYLCDFYVLIIPGLRQGERINRATEVALEVLFVIIVIIMIISFEKARRTNPGYPIGLDRLFKVQNQQASQAYDLPQISELKNNTMILLIKKAQLKQALQKNPSGQNHSLHEAFEYRFFVEETKWCDKCLNIKRPRVRHCSQCNQCVERMDHHCIWLNNCVGRRNHKFFMLFLFFLIVFLALVQVLLTLFTIIGVIELVDKENSVGENIEEKYGPLWKVIYIIGEIFAIGVWFYYVFVFCQQMYLILNNLTFVESFENILVQKKPWKKDSCCENLRQVFGAGCWICPTKINSTSHLLFGQQQNNKNPSVQLVEEVLGGNNNPMTNFQSEHHLRNQRNQI